MTLRIPLIALLVLALPASAQDTYTLDADGTIVYGDAGSDVYVGDVIEEYVPDYGVPLAPGEEIIGFYAAPSIVQMPMESDILYRTLPYDPPDEIDRVTGLPRNESGWTGEFKEPLGIGCFPQGVCTALNE